MEGMMGRQRWFTRSWVRQICSSSFRVDGSNLHDLGLATWMDNDGPWLWLVESNSTNYVGFLDDPVYTCLPRGFEAMNEFSCNYRYILRLKKSVYHMNSVSHPNYSTKLQSTVSGRHCSDGTTLAHKKSEAREGRKLKWRKRDAVL